MNPILALDPGSERSALVIVREGAPVRTFLESNETIRAVLREYPRRRLLPVHPCSVLVVEEIESFGMPVGREVFRTVLWAGRFIEAWGGAWVLVSRRAVKLHVCGSTRANDATIRQAMIDRFGPGRALAIGTKAKPGPLYGLKADLWAALALGLTYHDERARLERDSAS